MDRFVAPMMDERLFTCPHCGGLTSHRWQHVYNERAFSGVGAGGVSIPTPTGRRLETGVALSECVGCDQTTIWYLGKVVYPSTSTAPMPSADLPEHLTPDYLEARDIVTRSPRASAALLRLLIEKLVAQLATELGVKGKDLNEDIGNLGAKGLDPGVKEALDAVRVLGNESVHPGEINLNDSPEVAAALFGLVNYIVQEMITRPKQRKAVYELLPEPKKRGIEQRDKRHLPQS